MVSEERRQYMKEYLEKYKLVHAERMKDPEYRQKRREQRARWKKWVPQGDSLDRLLEYKKSYYQKNKERILARQKEQKQKKREEAKAKKEVVDPAAFCIVLE